MPEIEEIAGVVDIFEQRSTRNFTLAVNAKIREGKLVEKGFGGPYSLVTSGLRRTMAEEAVNGEGITARATPSQ